MATLHTRSLDLDGRISAYPLGNTIHSVSYDPASRVTGISGAETQSYGYDALDRLTSVTAPGVNQTYRYDRNGNRLTETLGAQATTYGYTPGKQPAPEPHPRHDAALHLRSRRQPHRRRGAHLHL